MSAPAPFEELPESPCTGRCCFDVERGYCMACFRALREITGWADADAEQRRAILQRCAQRRELHQEQLTLSR